MEKKGIFNSYWLFVKGKWIKVIKKCYSELIFDKFSPINKKQTVRRDSLFSNSKIKSFNNPRLYSLFFDKLKIYEKLKDFTIPTVFIENKNKESIDGNINTLRGLIANHSNRRDFSDKLVVKDRFGAGGNNIYRIGFNKKTDEILNILNKFKNTAFILQPFVKFEKGFIYKNYSRYIDIRIIYLKNKAVQVYIRTAKKKDFRCNEHQGGTLEYISIKDVPKKVIRLSNDIVRFLNENNALYALDFVISNNGNVYLMEGNNGPGIDWNLTLRKNENMSKKLIRLIVADISQRVKSNRNFMENYDYYPQFLG